MGEMLQIEYEVNERLPPLSWCAFARRGGPVRVRHGRDVEVRPEGFVEGAWDGDFDAFDFDSAHTLAGTGGRLRQGMLVFAAPFHPLERLFVLRGPDEIRVSNSLVFLLGEAGDGLDLAHPNYFFDLLAHVRRGILPPAATLRTAAGRQVELHFCCNLELRPDLTLSHAAKPLGPPPAGYADYFGMLLNTTEKLARNAAAPGRRTTYRLVAACSRGYDSTAAAAIAKQAGCREGVTFVQSARPVGHPLTGGSERFDDDSGSDALRALGLSVREFDRSALVKIPGHPRAEFFISSPAAITDATLRLMEDTLRGSVLVSGRHGERCWGPTSRCLRQNFRDLDDCHLSGQALTEFRLRAGFLHLPLPYIGGLHSEAICRITHAEEMKPWKLGTGYYDRPIARRIAEEAGVPREYFGHWKLGGGGGLRDLSPESESDFQSFFEAAVPERVRRRLDERSLTEREPQHRRLIYFRAMYAHLPLADAALRLLRIDHWHRMWNSKYLYHFHWGFERIKDRYDVRS